VSHNFRESVKKMRKLGTALSKECPSHLVEIGLPSLHGKEKVAIDVFLCKDASGYIIRTLCVEAKIQSKFTIGKKGSTENCTV